MSEQFQLPEEFDEEFSLHWTQPLTPRHATRGRRPHQRRDFASALQLEGCASKYADPVKIGAGAGISLEFEVIWVICNFLKAVWQTEVGWKWLEIVGRSG